jgi:hypothetical protein
MSPIPVNLAIEDELSEIVLRAIVAHVDRDYWIGTAYGHSGFGYLRKTVAGWNAAARGKPFLLLTDLDDWVCPSALIQGWLGALPHPNLVFRVAVREVEAWLLADRTNFAQFLSISEAIVPLQCDQLVDPKAELIRLARRARPTALRKRLVPKPESTAKQGPDYNGCLASFVRRSWDIDQACAVSPSLLRAVEKLRIFEPTWPAQFVENES